MKTLLYIITFCFSLTGFAQEELDPKTKPIAGGELKIKQDVPPKTEEPKKPEPPAVVEKPDPLKIAEAQLLKGPEQYKKDADPKNPNYKRNQYLGAARTASSTSTVRYRDAAAIDGDKIKVYVNDKLVKPEVIMDSEYQGFKVDLAEGVNKIDFIALNEGFASPNTAEFKVYNDKGVVIKSSQWNVASGYKATVLVLKE